MGNCSTLYFPSVLPRPTVVSHGEEKLKTTSSQLRSIEASFLNPGIWHAYPQRLCSLRTCHHILLGHLRPWYLKLVMTSNRLVPRTEWWHSAGIEWASGPCQGLKRSFDSLKLSIASLKVARDLGCISRAHHLRNTCADGQRKGGVDPDHGPARNS